MRTSFWAVPAFSRVEPARNSGPTMTTISWSTSSASGESGADTTAPVSAPAAAAASTAPTTNGVRPLALMPSTTSAAVTAASATSQRTGLGVVLGGVALGGGRQPRAGDDRRHPARRERERRLALGRIERRDRARGAGADVQQAAAALRGARRPRRWRRRSARTLRARPERPASSSSFISSTSSCELRRSMSARAATRLRDQVVLIGPRHEPSLCTMRPSGQYHFSSRSSMLAALHGRHPPRPRHEGVPGRLRRRRRREPRDSRRRIHRARRPVGLRQVDAAADDRRPGGGDRRHGFDRRRST